MAIAALVLGIVGLVISFIPGISIVGPICAIVGVVLGVIARKKAKEAGQPTGMATAGMILSIICLAIAVVSVIVAAVCVAQVANAVGQLGAAFGDAAFSGM